MQDFEGFFKAQYPRLCYFASQLTAGSLVAEDLVQDAFLKYYDRHSEFEQETAAVAYLYTTVRNSCLNHLRHQKVVTGYLHSKEADPIEEPAVLQAIIKAEALGEIYKAVDELPSGCASVFRLCYFEGLKNQEVADQLGVSINTIKTQKARALQFLRLRLSPEVMAILITLPTIVSRFR
ncbi:RNA polymerase sigma-70 factor [Flavihumibacter solisilvae]|uniref:HTH luxR-type domain-containing protein n=1 Tax=Flavihumibacter solisilvae TaxID=1349421 RepID=A0A0C1IUB1_9BACT|nr:RNA polymerase sigma-70 factor [Flavihumibacter solisilvae]KIC94054.1 hypothetical protein OI18_13680 [Flavihumibacter solisilvae]